MAGNQEQPLNKRPRKSPSLRNLVSSKMAVADIQGAVRILTSKETILPQTQETIKKLKEKHPEPHQDSELPPDPVDEDSCHKTNKEKLLKAVHSRPKFQQ